MNLRLKPFLDDMSEKQPISTNDDHDGITIDEPISVQNKGEQLGITE